CPPPKIHSVIETIRLADDARHVLVSVNPHAGSQNRQEMVTAFCHELAQRRFQVTVFHDIEALAGETERLFAGGQLRAVVAAGGDGTVRLVADRTPAGAPLLVFPLGTENLLAHYLELSPDPVQLARLIAVGVTVRLDAGRAGDRLVPL